MAQKKRITRQQMKKDSFVTAMFRAREWAELNLNVILIAVGAVVVAIAVIWFLSSQSGKKQAESIDMLGRAEIEARGNQPQLAIIDFKKVIDDFGGTPAARLATIKLANLYFDQNDFENAQYAFEDYLNNYQIDEPSRLSAIEGIAACLSAQGKNAEAGEKYLEAARLDAEAVTYQRSLFCAVDNFVKAEDRDGALQAFSLLEEQGITSEEFRTAKIILIESGFLSYQDGDYQ